MFDKKILVTLLTGYHAITAMEHIAAYAMLLRIGKTDKIKKQTIDERHCIIDAIKRGYESPLKHIVLTFRVKNLTRSCVIELSKNDRFLLTFEDVHATLKNKVSKILHSDFDYEAIAGDYQKGFELKEFLDFYAENPDINSEELKIYLPHFWPMDLILTTNVQVLRYMFKRLFAKNISVEFKKLAKNIFQEIPENFKYLFYDIDALNV